MIRRRMVRHPCGIQNVERDLGGYHVCGFANPNFTPRHALSDHAFRICYDIEGKPSKASRNLGNIPATLIGSNKQLCRSLPPPFAIGYRRRIAAHIWLTWATALHVHTRGLSKQRVCGPASRPVLLTSCSPVITLEILGTTVRSLTLLAALHNFGTAVTSSSCLALTSSKQMETCRPKRYASCLSFASVENDEMTLVRD